MPPAASSGPGRRNADEAFAAQIPDPEHDCCSGQGKQVNDRGLLAGEHQGGARACQCGVTNGAHFQMRANSRQDQSERRCAEERFMYEVPVVVDRQRSKRKQHRREQAGHVAEHLDCGAEEENRDRFQQRPT